MSVAAVIVEDESLCVQARTALGAVAPGPVRAHEAEGVLKGRRQDPEVVARAAEEAVARAKLLSNSAYKVELVKALVRKAVLSV